MIPTRTDRNALLKLSLAGLNIWEIKIANSNIQSEAGIVMHHAGRIARCKSYDLSI